MNSHPTRKELILGAQGIGAIAKKHLAGCSWCHLYFGLLAKYQFSGELPLPNAPQSWIDKAVLIAAMPNRIGKLKSIIAGISFDSWARPVLQGVRGETMRQERRILFETADTKFDVRAEYRRNHWDFTAKVTDAAGNIADCTLMVGKKVLTADEQGFYQWSSARPPQEFRLLTDEEEIEIPELSWKKSRPE